MLCLGGASRHCFSFFSDASRVIAPVSSNLAANESRRIGLSVVQDLKTHIEPLLYQKRRAS
jgi:hypothetical protein